MLLHFLKHLEKPVVATLRTILYKPNSKQKEIVSKIVQYADKVVCMNSLAVPLLEKIYGIPREKIEIIHHGAPSKLMKSKKDTKINSVYKERLYFLLLVSSIAAKV